MKDYDSQEELSDSEDPDLLSELQELDVDEQAARPQVLFPLPLTSELERIRI